MSEFKQPPTLVVEGIEGVRAALNEDRKRPFGLSVSDGFGIKAPWLISLIDEIESSGEYPYNSTVKRVAESRLGLPPKADAEYAREGDMLSLLIYNAHCYRRHDILVSGGFIPFTGSVLVAAFQQGLSILCGQNTYRVRSIGGNLYAMLPRKRKYALSVCGQPVKLVAA